MLVAGYPTRVEVFWVQEQYGLLLSRTQYWVRGTVDSEIFAISIKRHISDVKNSRLRQGLPISINDRVILQFREGLFSRNFRESKVLAKIPNFQYWFNPGNHHSMTEKLH